MEQIYSLGYILKLIKAFFDSSAGDYMFIKHYNSLSLQEEDLVKIVNDTRGEYCLLFYRYSQNHMQEPYQPFLGWIRKLYFEYFSDETPEEFVKNAKVYPMQQYSFAEYIRTGKADRVEDVMMNELTYEGKRMLDSLVNIYKYICARKHLFVVLDNMQLTNLSGVKAVRKLMSINCPGKFRMAATYNESYHIFDYIAPEWKLFTDEVESQGYLYEWGEVDEETNIDAQNIFVPVSSQVDEYLLTARNMFYFVCYEDAHFYLNVIYDKIKHSNLTITRQQYAVFLQLLSLIHIMCGEYSSALQFCEYLGIIAKEDNDERLAYNYNYLCAMTQFGTERLDNKIAVYVERCRKIAKRLGDDLAEYKPQILQLLFECNFWRDIYIDSYGKYVSDEFYEKTERFGFKNILAYINIYCFSTEHEELLQVARHEKELVNINKGIDLATEIENYELLISAYTKNIVIFARTGCHEYVAELFEKKLAAINIEKNPIRMVHTYNGMGYNASATEKYQKAEEYFSASIEQLVTLGNGEEIAITLYNSALNKMLAREYAYASDDLLLLVKVMEILEIHALPITDTARFFGMLGICSFYIGEDYRCCYCLNRIEAYVNHLEYVDDEEKYNYWLDALFMKHLIKAMMAVSDGKYEEAEAYFEDAKDIMERDMERKFLSYFLYVQELAKYYDVLGEEQKRQDILKEGIEYCEQNGYRMRCGVLMAELHKKHEVNKKGIALKRKVSSEEIIDVVEKLALHNKLEERKKDISFLTIWQDLLSKSKSADEVMSHTFKLFKNHFDFDGVFMIEVQNDKAWIKYKDCPELVDGVDNVTKRILELNGDDLNHIVEYFENNRNAFLTNRVDKGFFEYKPVLNIIGLYQVVTLFAAPLYYDNGKLHGILMGYVEMRKYAIPNRYLLKEHDLVVLKFAAEQLHNTLEKLNYIELIQKMNEQLSEMAIKDQLTGLYNRQGFEKRMNEWDLDRESNKVIIYIDLDNFKFYNDNFGHELGDYVLVRISQMFKDVVKDSGYAVRFGGDEFVIVLKEKDAKYGEMIVQNMFEKMNAEVIPDVIEKTGGKIAIPEDKKLSFSVGIAECRGNTDVAHALNHADRALYSVKKSTKNGYVVWDESIKFG